MKILVTGASGLLGRSLMKLLAERSGLEVKGVAFSRAAPPLEKLDLTDERAVALFFARYSPEVVVHLAAERRPDVVDTALSPPPPPHVPTPPPPPPHPPSPPPPKAPAIKVDATLLRANAPKGLPPAHLHRLCL
jgi:hypothetical protein